MLTNLDTDFENAIMREDADKILSLLQLGANPNQKLELQVGPNELIIERPLHRVSSPAIIIDLLTFGADPDVKRVVQYKFSKTSKPLIRYWLENGNTNSANYYQRVITLLQFKPFYINTTVINDQLIQLLLDLEVEDDLMDERGALIKALIQASTNLKFCIMMTLDRGFANPFSIALQKGLVNVLRVMFELNGPLPEQVKINECERYGIEDENTVIHFKSLYESRTIKKFMDCFAIWQLLRFTFFQQPAEVYLPLELIQSILLIIVDYSISSDTFYRYLSYRNECSLQLQTFDKIYNIICEASNLLVNPHSLNFSQGRNFLAPHFCLNLEKNLNENPSELVGYAWLLTKLHYKNYSEHNEGLNTAIKYWYKKADTKLSLVPTFSFFDSPEERATKIEERVNWHLSQSGPNNF